MSDSLLSVAQDLLVSVIGSYIESTMASKDYFEATHKFFSGIASMNPLAFIEISGEQINTIFDELSEDDEAELTNFMYNMSITLVQTMNDYTDDGFKELQELICRSVTQVVDSALFDKSVRVRIDPKRVNDSIILTLYLSVEASKYIIMNMNKAYLNIKAGNENSN